MYVPVLRPVSRPTSNGNRTVNRDGKYSEFAGTWAVTESKGRISTGKHMTVPLLFLNARLSLT